MTVTKFDTRSITREVSLRQNEIWRAEGDLRGEQITCSSGQIWVTQQNDRTDYVLNPGEVFWVTRTGTLLVQALKDGEFCFSRLKAGSQPVLN